jgi:hypothetical protein
VAPEVGVADGATPDPDSASCSRFSCSGESDERITRPRKLDSSFMTFSGCALRTSTKRAEVLGCSVSPICRMKWVVDAIVNKRARQSSATCPDQAINGHSSQRVQKQQANERAAERAGHSAGRGSNANDMNTLLQIDLAIWLPNGNDGVLKVDQILLLKARQFNKGAVSFGGALQADNDEFSHVILLVRAPEAHGMGPKPRASFALNASIIHWYPGPWDCSLMWIKESGPAAVTQP